MGEPKPGTARKTAITAKLLDGVIENEIRPQLARHSALIEKLSTDQRSQDRRISEIESGFTNLSELIVSWKNDMGKSLSMILRIQTKCREDILERIDQLPGNGGSLEHDR